MLHEVVATPSRSNSMLLRSKPAAKPESLYSGEENGSGNIQASVWPTTSMKCSEKLSLTRLPEISEFLREEKLNGTSLPLPVCGSYVELLKSDDWKDKTTMVKETNRFLNLTLVSSAGKVTTKRSMSGDPPPDCLSPSGQKKLCSEYRPTRHKVANLQPLVSDGANSYHLSQSEQVNVEKNRKRIPSDKYNFFIQQESTVYPQNCLTDSNATHACVRGSSFTNLLLDANSASETMPPTQTALFPAVKMPEEPSPFPVCSTANQTIDNIELARNNGVAIPQGGATDLRSIYNQCSNKPSEFNDRSLADNSFKSVEDTQTNEMCISPSEAIFLGKNEHPKRLNSSGHSHPIDFQEITWEDARNHTQLPEGGVLQFSVNNSLLEDVDLSDVDSACMEQFEREYQQEAAKETEIACSLLKIPLDAETWTEHHVDKWIMWTVHQCKLPAFSMAALRMTGAELCKLGEAEMLSRVPTCGDIIHSRLRIWKSVSKMIENQSEVDNPRFPSKPHHCYAPPHPNKMNNDLSDDQPGQTGPNSCNTTSHCDNSSQLLKPPQTSSIHLWMFLKELLQQPQLYGQFIRWINKDEGVFKIEDSMEVARLWGVRKNRPAMNYDKLSRSIRQYYKKGIIKKTPVSQRLVYQFVNPGLSMPI